MMGTVLEMMSMNDVDGVGKTTLPTTPIKTIKLVMNANYATSDAAEHKAIEI